MVKTWDLHAMDLREVFYVGEIVPRGIDPINQPLSFLVQKELYQSSFQHFCQMLHSPLHADKWHETCLAGGCCAMGEGLVPMGLNIQ